MMDITVIYWCDILQIAPLAKSPFKFMIKVKDMQLRIFKNYN